MNEIWKDVKGYEGLYQVSNTGQVFSIRSKKFLKQGHTGWGEGYAFVALCKNGMRKNKNVHRLVAEAFIPNPENKPEVNHIDHNPHNNNANNLEWVTHQENWEAFNRSEKKKQVIEKLKAIAEKKKAERENK